MKKRAAGAAGALDDFLGENLEIVGVFVVLFADHFDDPCPSASQADHLVALLQGAACDSTDRRVQAGDVSAAGEDTDYAFFGVDVSHEPFASVRSAGDSCDSCSP